MHALVNLFSLGDGPFGPEMAFMLCAPLSPTDMRLESADDDASWATTFNLLAYVLLGVDHVTFDASMRTHLPGKPPADDDKDRIEEMWLMVMLLCCELWPPLTVVLSYRVLLWCPPTSASQRCSMRHKWSHQQSLARASSCTGPTFATLDFRARWDLAITSPPCATWTG